jgi:hypothetical protein
MPAPPHSINSSALTIRRTGVTEYWIGTAASVCLDIGRPNHLAPLLDFVGDELAKVRGRARKRCAPQIGHPRLQLGIGEARIDLIVQLVDDPGRRSLWRAEAEPATKQRGAERLTLALRPFPFLGCPHTRKGNQARS